MSIARVLSFAFSGIQPVPVEVQVQIASGLPAFLVVGLADISGAHRAYFHRGG
jgi:magnesium chelatase family protein